MLSVGTKMKIEIKYVGTFLIIFKSLIAEYIFIKK